MPIVEQLMSIRDVARHLSLSTRAVYRLVADGQLPYVKIGAVRRFSENDVQAFIEGLRKQKA